MDTNNNNLTQKIIDKIEQGKVKMKPKAYFVLKTILISLASIFILLFALFLISFIIFGLRSSGLWLMPGLGFFGLKTFLISLPWFLILLALVLIVLLEMFAKRFAALWRWPIVFSVLVILLVTISAGFAIDKTKMHQGLFMRAQEKGVPVIGRFYKGNMMRPRDLEQGIIEQKKDNGFIIKTNDGKIFEVIIDSRARVQPGLNIGDMAVVLGKKDNGKIKAKAIQKINNGFFRPAIRPIK